MFRANFSRVCLFFILATLLYMCIMIGRKEGKDMTALEELLKAQKELNDKIQNEFIDGLVDKVEILLERANKKGYEPTEHERECFSRIYKIIVNMNQWF